MFARVLSKTILRKLPQQVAHLHLGASASICLNVGRTTGGMQRLGLGLGLARSFSSATGTLNELLVQEVTYEMTSEESIDQEVEDSKAQITDMFKIEEHVGHGAVKMNRSFSGEEIFISFDCQDEADMDDMPFDMQNPEEQQQIGSGQEGEDEVDPGLDYGINFEVTITKGDTKLHFDCIAASELRIENIRFFTNGVSTECEDTYGGPKFHDLEQKVQDSFYDYLQERGIDNDLGFFVLSYSRFKEQNEYINWLNNVISFTAK